VDYFNNKVICDLVEAPHSGIMAQLDEACYMVGKVNDQLFLDSLSSKLSSHKHFTSRKVSHHPVTYTTDRSGTDLISLLILFFFFLLGRPLQ